MKLIPEQIDQLYTFTRQHYVEWYDLQSELVDHLANAIETELEENPKLTFDEALSKEFQKFGVFGFMDVIEEKRKSLGKKYNLIIWHHFKAFFRIPKIILTASTIGIVYMILKQIEDTNIFVFGYLIILLSVLFYKTFQNKKSLKKEKKKWLFKEIIFNYGYFGSFSILTYQLMNHLVNGLNWITETSFSLLFISVILVFLSIYFYISFYIIPVKAEEYLQVTYPEYELAKQH